MKIKSLTLFFSLFLTHLLFGQGAQTKTLKDLYDNKKFDEIINYTAKDTKEFEGKALYFIGMAYYMKQDDENAMKYLDMAIKKGPVDYDMYYYKGMEYYYGKKYREAIVYFKKAIEMMPTEPNYYGSMGDAYLGLENMDSALIYCKKAISYSNCNTRYYMLVGEISAQNNNYTEALNTYKTVLPMLSATDNADEYNKCFYNIGLMQELMGDSVGAKTTFEKFVKENPHDYHAIAKLIQTYYANGEYDKTLPYKKLLYDAHKNDSLPEEMSKMFCFDQFKWGGKNIMAFEHYDEPAGDYMYIKHTFYIINDSGKVEYRIQSESDALLHSEHPDEQYVLCLVNDSGYHTYWDFIFNDDVKYPALKKAVLSILNGTSKAGSTTNIGK
jgi:tetratricopeptide (TPR) repeat protein